MQRWIRRATLALLLLMTGCGQKGELYLPDRAEQAQTADESEARP